MQGKETELRMWWRQKKGANTEPIRTELAANALNWEDWFRLQERASGKSAGRCRSGGRTFGGLASERTVNEREDADSMDSTGESSNMSDGKSPPPPPPYLCA